MGKVIKWGLGGIVVLVILVTLFGESPENETPTVQDETQSETTETEMPMIVDIEEFVAEFDNNQLRAETQYEDVLIEITGEVSNISEDILGSYYVTLQPEGQDFYIGTQVQCYFDNQGAILDISNGDVVTMIGRVDTQSVNVLVRECALVTME